ncbi:hypothetical protein SCALM49S_04634 [Streptomyces californicus]
MVVISRPSAAATARVRQETARRWSTRTVQAPHCPWSQPFLVPVRSRRSRRASSRVVRWWTGRWCFSPLMFRVMALDVDEVAGAMFSLLWCRVTRNRGVGR